MDDILYFLLLVGWLAFSFYQQSVKKKKKQEQMRAAQQMQQHQESGEEETYEQESEETSAPMTGERSTNFKSVLEEILLGKQMSQEIVPENEAESLETIPEVENSLKDEESAGNIYQKYYDNEIAGRGVKRVNKIEGELEGPEEEFALSEEHHRDEADAQTNEVSNFNLRQAIIYSEILNRRYTN